MSLTVQGRRRSAAVAATGLAALIGAVMSAGTASAHSPVWSVTCNSVSVDLTSYSTSKHVTNSVTLTIVGGEGALVDQNFPGSFHFHDALPPHDAPISLHLVVRAGDDRTYDLDQTKVSPVCEDHTTPPTSPATTAPTTTPATTAPDTTAPPTGDTTAPATPTASGTTSAPAAAGTTSATAGGDLAETGSSSATPVIAGIAAVVVAAGGGLLFWNRRRGSAAHR
jgi:LPXTG-motif cell wall-anchored protein